MWKFTEFIDMTIDCITAYLVTVKALWYAKDPESWHEEWERMMDELENE